MVEQARTLGRLAVCTIVSRNYAAFARTLMQSLRATNPELDRFVFVADSNLDGMGGSRDELQWVSYWEIGLPEPRRFAFRYSILELNTAIKPWCLDWLLSRGYAGVIYLDPDIFVYSRLDRVLAGFRDGFDCILTPHLTSPLEDDRRPSVLDILRAGTYNLGFIALSSGQDARHFINWWKRCTEYDCVVDVASGRFVDQRWVDLAPGFIERVLVLREPGYNCAYWNLHERAVCCVDDGYEINGQPLVFFHFSGFDPLAPERLSIHQDRFWLSDLPAVSQLACEYAAKVRANGLAETRKLVYGFGFLANGAPISKRMRQLFRSSPRLVASAGEDPFQLSRVDFTASESQARLASLALWIALKVAGRLPVSIQRRLRDAAGRLPGYRRWKASLVDVGRGQAPHRAVVASKAEGGDRAPALKRVVAPLLAARHRRRGGRPETRRRGHAALSSIEKQNKEGDDSTVSAALDVTGYWQHQTGIGESARRFASVLEATPLDFACVDCSSPSAIRRERRRVEGLESSRRGPPRFNVLHVNADQTPSVYEALWNVGLRDQYRIGVWHWEGSHFPDRWLDSFDWVDEIWAPSRFIWEVVAEKATVPVVWMPHAVSVPHPKGTRLDYGLPADCFLFLVMYDPSSVTERKNPEGSIEAYRRAFGDRLDVGLVVKVHGDSARGAEIEELQGQLDGLSNSRLLVSTIDRDAVYGLENACDAFLSLHRAEGFGLSIAECMALGKPVVATGWSGNMDFMAAKNSCPIEYHLFELDQGIGPYEKGTRWAEPDLDHAVWWMKALVEDEGLRRRIGLEARKSIHAGFSPKVIGRRVVARLALLERRALDRRDSFDRE